MYWGFVIDYPHKSFDNYRSQDVAFEMSGYGLAYTSKICDPRIRTSYYYF